MFRERYSPEVIFLAENHPSLRETRVSYVTELNIAAGTLETPRVPESIHGMQQESINDLATTPRATSYSIVVVVVVVIVAVVIVVVVVRRRCRSVLFGAVHIVSCIQQK